MLIFSIACEMRQQNFLHFCAYIALIVGQAMRMGRRAHLRLPVSYFYFLFGELLLLLLACSFIRLVCHTNSKQGNNAADAMMEGMMLGAGRTSHEAGY